MRVWPSPKCQNLGAWWFWGISLKFCGHSNFLFSVLVELWHTEIIRPSQNGTRIIKQKYFSYDSNIVTFLYQIQIRNNIFHNLSTFFGWFILIHCKNQYFMPYNNFFDTWNWVTLGQKGSTNFWQIGRSTLWWPSVKEKLNFKPFSSILGTISLTIIIKGWLKPSNKDIFYVCQDIITRQLLIFRENDVICYWSWKASKQINVKITKWFLSFSTNILYIEKICNQNLILSNLNKYFGNYMSYLFHCCTFFDNSELFVLIFGTFLWMDCNNNNQQK